MTNQKRPRVEDRPTLGSHQASLRLHSLPCYDAHIWELKHEEEVTWGPRVSGFTSTGKKVLLKATQRSQLEISRFSSLVDQGGL